MMKIITEYTNKYFSHKSKKKHKEITKEEIKYLIILNTFFFNIVSKFIRIIFTRLKLIYFFKYILGAQHLRNK